MKKLFYLFLFIFILYPFLSNAAVVDGVKGRILLQVEKNGEAWYVLPDGVMNQGRRYYMKDGDAAYSVMRQFSTGISNADLAKIPVGFEDRFECTDNDGDGLCNKLEEGLGTDINNKDSDGDGFDDGTEIRGDYNPLGSDKLSYDYSLSNRLKGKIMLQVEEDGQAWYIHSDDGKRYYMPDGNAAYQIMRFLSLGITDNDLSQIENYNIGYRDTNGSWGLSFGEIINMLTVINTLPDNVRQIEDTLPLNSYDKVLFMTRDEYEAAYQLNINDGKCSDEYIVEHTFPGYYCTKLIEDQWVEQGGGGTISFLLEDNSVYRRLGSVVSSVTLEKTISDNLKLKIRFHDETTDQSQKLTAYNVSTIGGADPVTGLLSEAEIKSYFIDFLNELGLDSNSLDNLNLAKTSY